MALFPIMYRLWAKCRKNKADAWENDHPRAFFACGKQRSAGDAVYRRAIAAEAAARSGNRSDKQEGAATFVWDMKSLYEKFCHGKMKQRAHKHDFDPVITEVTLAAYKSARFLVDSGGATTLAGYASSGMPAGCIFATTWVKIYCLDAFDSVTAEFLLLRLDAYIDDIASSATGEHNSIIDTLGEGSDALLAAIDVDLKCALAADKCTVVASDPVLARRLRARLGENAGAAVDSTAWLGIDYLSGAKTGGKKGPEQSERSG